MKENFIKTKIAITIENTPFMIKTTPVKLKHWEPSLKYGF